MDYSESHCYAHGALGTEQHAVNRDTYSERYALFLEDDEMSEVEVLHSCNDHNVASTSHNAIPTSCEATQCSTFYEATTLETDSSISHGSPTRQKHKVPGYCRVVLEKADEVQSFFIHADPQLSVIYVDQDQSFECVRMTRQCFEQLLISCDIFSALKDNILHIGYRKLELEIAPPCPRSRFIFQTGIGHEFVYGLRFIEWNNRLAGRPWSLRQCVVYNKIHNNGNRLQWLVFKPPQFLKDQVDASLSRPQHDIHTYTFETHVAFVTAAIAMWRPYFIWITEKVEYYVQQVPLSSFRGDGLIDLAKGNSLVELKNLENELLDALLAIQATKDVVQCLRALYATIDGLQSSVGREEEGRRRRLIDYAASALVRQTDMLIEQATTILQKINGTSGLIASFLNLGNEHSLKELALQSKEETRKMSELARSANRDTKAVKALSVITLIYLPVTVVLNFFSTSFVDNSSGSVNVVGRWWLLIAVSAPLTVTTLFVWAIWTFRQKSVIGDNSDQHDASSDNTRVASDGGFADLEK